MPFIFKLPPLKPLEVPKIGDWGSLVRDYQRETGREHVEHQNDIWYQPRQNEESE